MFMSERGPDNAVTSQSAVVLIALAVDGTKHVMEFVISSQYLVSLVTNQHTKSHETWVPERKVIPISQ